MELFRLLGTIAVNDREAISSINSVSGTAAKASAGMSKAFKAVGLALAGAFSVAKMTQFGKACIEAYNVQSQAELKLETIMKQRMGSSDKEIQKTKDLASAQQRLGVVGDELQLSGAQQLSTFLSSEKALDSLIPAMNNLAVQQNGVNVTSENMVSIGNMMGKVMQGQTSALRRVGITFTEAQEKALKYGTEEEKAAVLAQVITDNVGEMNKKFAETDAGKIQQAKNLFGDLQEMIGGKLIHSVAIAYQKLGEFSVFVMDNFDQIVSITKTVAKAFSVMMSAKLVLSFISAFQKAKLQVALFGMSADAAAFSQGILNGELTIGESIIAIFSGKVKLSKVAMDAWKQSTLGTVAAQAKHAISTKASTIATTASTIADRIKTSGLYKLITAHKLASVAALGLAAGVIALAVYMVKSGTSADELAAKITGFADKLAGMITSFANKFPSMVDSFVSAFSNVINAIVGALPTMLPAIIQAGIALFMGLVKSLTQIIQPLVQALITVVKAVADALPVLIPAIVQAGITLFMALVQALPEVITALVAAIPQIVDAIVGVLPTLIPALIQGAIQLFMAFVDAISQIIPAIVAALPQIIEAVMLGLQAGFLVIWSVIKAGAIAAWDGIKAAAQEKWELIKEKITHPIDVARQKVHNGIQKIKGYFDFSNIVAKTQEKWESLKAKMVSPIQTARDKVNAGIKKIKSYFSFDALISKVSSKWNSIKKKMTSPIESARDKINGVIKKIKGFFPISIGKIMSGIKTPSFSLNWSSKKFGKLGTIKYPTGFDVSWNAKGAIFDKPTIFATAQGFQGVGEAGKEAVAPIDTLQKYVSDAVSSQNSELVGTLKEILSAIQAMDAGMYQTIDAALDNRKIQWNDRELGRFVKSYAR